MLYAEVLMGEGNLFEIVMGSDFLYDGTGELFTCTFYCQTECGAFPDMEWTDFAQTVLCWWSETILRITAAKETTFELLFEDGPYRIAGRKKDDIVTLHFATDKKSEKTIPDIQLEFCELAASVEKAMRQLASLLYLSGNTVASLQMQKEAAKIKRRFALL